MPTYIVSEKSDFYSFDELNIFLTTKHREGIGDYSKNKELDIIYIDKNGKRIEGPQE